MTNLERYKKDLARLFETSLRLEIGMVKALGMLDQVEDKEILKIKPLDFRSNYEQWYTESLAIIEQIIPNRKNDFVRLYRDDKRKPQVDYLSYNISDFLMGIIITRGPQTIVDGSAAFPKFKMQVSILESVLKRFDSSLFDIRQLVQADLFDSEIDSVKELNSKGFTRAAGVICGVIIEKHLKLVCENHDVSISKRHPTIADFNDALKSNEVFEIATWRSIQRLADIRNMAGHNKERDPSKDEITELIDGTDKIIKTIF